MSTHSSHPLTTVAALAVPMPTPPAVPPLTNGDRLSRDDFERRYEAMPEVKKAELIEGVVYMASPVSTTHHGAPHADLACWLGMYRAMTLGVQVADNATVRLDWDNEPQPDVFLRVLPACGGQTRDDGPYVAGAPELCCEVAASSAAYDLHDKKEAFRRNGVCEYLVWRTQDQAIDWFVLHGGVYDVLTPGADGVTRSEVFPGLWLDTKALIAGDMQRVLATLNEGLASAEHGEFAGKLEAARPRKPS